MTLIKKETMEVIVMSGELSFRIIDADFNNRQLEGLHCCSNFEKLVGLKTSQVVVVRMMQLTRVSQEYSGVGHDL